MKLCIITCWFGKLPTYFEIWKKSCENNKNIDFLLFTDQEITNYSDNLIIERMNLKDLKKLFEKKLNMRISLENAYKICDFRPAFGIIFEDYLKGYDYWGHCDIDQVWGKIEDFIVKININDYERINHNGPFSLYKNNKKMNTMFKNKGAKFSYKEVFTNKENYAFDEFTGINMICLKNNVKSFYFKEYGDLEVSHCRYTIKQLNNYKVQSYLLENQKLFRVFYKGNVLNKEELIYIHFQKKKPNIKDNIKLNEYILMGSACFDNINKITKKSIEKSNPYKGLIYEIIENIIYYLKKIRTFILSNNKIKRIWIIQKFFRGKI